MLELIPQGLTFAAGGFVESALCGALAENTANVFADVKFGVKIGDSSSCTCQGASDGDWCGVSEILMLGKMRRDKCYRMGHTNRKPLQLQPLSWKYAAKL